MRCCDTRVHPPNLSQTQTLSGPYSKFFRINTCKIQPANSFNFHTYEKRPGVAGAPALSIIPVSVSLSASTPRPQGSILLSHSPLATRHCVLPVLLFFRI